MRDQVNLEGPESSPFLVNEVNGRDRTNNEFESTLEEIAGPNPRKLWSNITAPRYVWLFHVLFFGMYTTIFIIVARSKFGGNLHSYDGTWCWSPISDC